MKPILLVPLGLAALLSGCAGGSESLARATSLYPGGRESFERYSCTRCHDQGDGGYGPRMVGNPRLRDLEYIRERIRQGKTVGGAQMPAYPNIPKKELDELASFVRALAGWW